MRRKIKLDLSGSNAAKLIEKAGTVVSKMTGNADFPDPTPSLADLTAANEALAAAAIDASGGDRDAILVRKEKEQTVANMLRTLAAYITMTSNGNGAIMKSSGFELQRLPEPMPDLLRPIDFKSLRGLHTGEVLLSWKSVRGARSYIIEMTTDDPATLDVEWKSAAITTKAKFKFENMPVGNYYYYRVKALGRKNESAWSDISMVMTAA